LEFAKREDAIDVKYEFIASAMSLCPVTSLSSTINLSISQFSNFRVTRGTFTCILHEIGDEISQQNTPMRKAVKPNRQLAIALYYLASTAKYRTVGNLFGVSVAFACACIREVCEAII